MPLPEGLHRLELAVGIRAREGGRFWENPKGDVKSVRVAE